MDQRIARVYLHKLSEIKSFPTDIDKDFIDNLINSVLPIGYEGLQLVEEYVRQLPDNGNIQILLAVYIEILRQELMEVSPQHPSSIELMIESEKVKLFLEDYKGRFFDEDSSILQDLAFRLIDAAEVVRRKSPFNIDVNSQILHFLLDERTNINVRKTIENLAIQRISNSEEPSLLDGIVEILLGTDYRIIVNNIARIIEPFVQRLSIQQAEELMEKAKNTEKIGVLFARLSAAIYDRFRSANIATFDISMGFCDPFTHSSVLSEALNCQAADTSNIKELLDLLLKTSTTNADFIIPHLDLIKVTFSNFEEILTEKVVPLLGNPRYCSDENLQEFIHFVKHNRRIPLSKVFSAIKDRIMVQPKVLSFFVDRHDAKNEYLENLCQNGLSDYISQMFGELLVAQTNEDIEWEKADTTIEMIRVSIEFLDIDKDVLFSSLLKLVKTAKDSFLEFARTNALQLLCERFTIKMIREFAEIYAKMEEDIEMKILIIKSAKNTLITHGNMRADDLLDEVCLFAISVLDDIESNDDYNSSDFTKSITSLCDELLSVYTSHRRNGQDENCLVNKLKNRLEENSTRMRGQSSRKRPATHQSVQEELEEIIHTLGRECESGLDPCISKECY